LVSNKSVGFVVNATSFSEANLLEAISKSLKFLGCEQAKEIKLIGDTTLGQRVEAFIAKYGPVKLVPRDGNHEILFYPDENRTRVAPRSENKSTVTLVEKEIPAVHRKTKVMIVDDSKTIRTLLKKVMSKSEKIEIIADTGDPLEVIQLIKDKKPDVITLDIHMPKMDGLTLLKKYIPDYPIPTVMITSISMEEGPTVLNALEAGAVDYIKKPEMDGLAEAGELIIDKVLSAATARVRVHRKHTQKISSPAISGLDTDAFIAIGASTGGTEALRVLLTQLPAEIPPILIVQHIPAGFSNAFAKRLNSLCPFEVLEAQDNDEVLKNRVLIAPGGRQMRAVCKSSRWHVVIDDSPPVNRHKPSVDYLFNSLADYEFRKPVGVILTGMGGDGAKGLLKLREKGWMTIAQDKESCVVFGMPAVAIDLGAAQHVCNLHDIANKIQQLIPSRKIA
jgi:two-component system chemotaxis response regulator CheB